MIGPIHAREYYFAKAAREIAEAAMREQELFNSPNHSWVEQVIAPFQEWAKELEEGARDPGLFRLMACRALLLAVHFERLEAGEGNIPTGQEQDEAFDDEVQW